MADITFARSDFYCVLTAYLLLEPIDQFGCDQSEAAVPMAPAAQLLMWVLKNLLAGQ
jgi:hypothetical protein